MSFKLPKNIKAKRTMLPDGAHAYEFKHKQKRKLGPLLLKDVGGQTHILAEVAGSQNDPRTAKRQAILEPIVKALSEEMARKTGSPGVDVPPPRATASPQGEWVGQKMLLCEQCDAPVALLVFAEGDPADEGLLEDYARKMYDKIAEANLPTWIIGPPIGLVSSPEAPSDIMKAWPERGPVERLTPNEFNDTLDILQTQHCDPDQRTAFTQRKREEFARYHNTDDEDGFLAGLMEETKTVHRDIHREDPGPRDVEEAETSAVWDQTQEVILSLVVDGVPIAMLETAIFYQFSQLNSLLRGKDAEVITGTAGRMEKLLKAIVEELRGIEESLVDDGPSEKMEALGSKLEVLKQAFHDGMKPPTGDLYEQADKINRALFALTAAFLDEEIDPYLIQSCYMYFWLRTSTINANVSELFFQKLERNWPLVTQRVKVFLNEWLEREVATSQAD